MKKFLLASLLLTLGVFGLNAQILYEDFEGGTSDLAWAAADGTYNGVLGNPGPDAVNPSSFVGSYTKGAGFGYSLFWVPSLAQPLDLSEYNQFHLKVWCATATPILLKFEGPGQAVEKKVDMPAAGQWVDLKFDMSAGANKTGLTKIIIFFDPGNDPSANTYYFDDLVAEKAQICYETFEGGAQLPWAGLDGVYDGAVANPAPDAINGSATVGKYTKSGAHEYSLLLADLGATTLDLSVLNQFKLKIYTTAPTQVLLKLEGPGVAAVEKIKNIAVTNAWQEYTFDMSAGAANTGLTKIILFFDPGVLTSADTYYFDDLCAVPNPCPGVTPDPDIMDDFECNRNITYAGDWTALSVVNNPAPSGDNNSPKVGRWEDPSGNGTEFSNFQADYQNPIDLSVRNQFSLKLWAPKAGRLLLKMEGGSGAKEIEFQVTELNKWVNYTADFSSEIGKGHKKFVVFINAFVNGEPGDVYFVDDIKLAAPAAAPPLEDFQGGVHLDWGPLDQNGTLHGAFTAPSPNSSPNGVNSSTDVGCYAKGTSPFSTLVAVSGVTFDLSVYPQFNLDVLSPFGGGKVTMQLSGPSGNQEVTANVTTPGAWETLGFDFSAFSAVTDFNEVRLTFNAGTANQGQSWCIDNLRQSGSTVDPCADVVAKPNIIDDYECQRNYTAIFYGTDDVKAVNNPYLLPNNGSLKVGEYKDPTNQPYAGIGIEFAQAPDLAVYNQLKLQVYSAKANVPFLFKLEGGTTAVEKFDTLTEANKWYDFTIDFSGAVGTDCKKLVIFFDVATDNGGTYYVDNIRWSRKGYTGCVDDHETALTSINNFTYFNNGGLSGQTAAIVDNPLPAGINTSAKVGKLVQAGDAGIYAGMYADLESEIDFKGNKQVKVKLLMDHIGTHTMKIEVFGNPVPPIEVTLPNTKVNEWEELTFNFSAYIDGDKYYRLTMFPDITSVGSGTDKVTYYDDIVIGNGQCGIVGTFSPYKVEAMVISPNPANDLLHVENFSNVSRMDVFDILGQRMISLNTQGEGRTDIDIMRLPAGLYTLTGYNAQNVLIGNAKFVKQ